MIKYATKDEQRKHDEARHHATHQCANLPCLWGYSNIKHLDHSGELGRAGRRKRNGWWKGWAKEYRHLMGLPDSAPVPPRSVFGSRRAKKT